MTESLVYFIIAYVVGGGLVVMLAAIVRDPDYPSSFGWFLSVFLLWPLWVLLWIFDLDL